jgi:hypothetical protein
MNYAQNNIMIIIRLQAALLCLCTIGLNNGIGCLFVDGREEGCIHADTDIIFGFCSTISVQQRTISNPNLLFF